MQWCASISRSSRSSRGPDPRCVLASSTPLIDAGGLLICGRLYRAYSREIQVDNGFVRAMLLTHCFTAPEKRGRITLAPIIASRLSRRAESSSSTRDQWSRGPS